MKVELSFGDEWYPMTSAEFPGDEFYNEKNAVEVPDEVAERWKRVTAEFWTMQKEMEAYPDPSGSRPE